MTLVLFGKWFDAPLLKYQKKNHFTKEYTQFTTFARFSRAFRNEWLICHYNPFPFLWEYKKYEKRISVEILIADIGYLKKCKVSVYLKFFFYIHMWWISPHNEYLGT